MLRTYVHTFVCARLSGSAGGGTDLLRDVGVGLGHQEAQTTSSQTNQIHRTARSIQEEVERERESSYVKLSRDRVRMTVWAPINQSNQLA